MSLKTLLEGDVVVVGGGTSGVIAAVASARNGARTVLVEESGALGGTASQGLMNVFITFQDSEGNYAVRGIGHELVDRLVRFGASTGDLGDIQGDSYSRVTFEPEAMKMVCLQMIEEASVQLLLHTHTADVDVEANRILSLLTESKSGRHRVGGEVFVDASGDGDVAAAAGALFEMSSKEALQPMTLIFKMANVDVVKLISYMKSRPEEFQFAVPPEQLTKQAFANTLKNFPPMKEAVASGKLPKGIIAEQTWFFVLEQEIESGIVGINMTRAEKVDGTDVLDLTRAEIQTRKQAFALADFFRKSLPGFERSYVAMTAPQIGVRESRRIIGDYVLEEDDILKARRADDAVARGSTPIDIHGGAKDKGKMFWIKTDKLGIKPYDIPFRCLYSKDISNLLLSGRCISATREAQGAIRMMPVCMATGQASGTAAALAAKKGVIPKDLEISELREILKNQGQIL